MFLCFQLLGIKSVVLGSLSVCLFFVVCFCLFSLWSLCLQEDCKQRQVWSFQCFISPGCSSSAVQTANMLIMLSNCCQYFEVGHYASRWKTNLQNKLLIVRKRDCGMILWHSFLNFLFATIWLQDIFRSLEWLVGACRYLFRWKLFGNGILPSYFLENH